MGDKDFLPGQVSNLQSKRGFSLGRAKDTLDLLMQSYGEANQPQYNVEKAGVAVGSL
jgi:hypothetical protein